MGDSMRVKHPEVLAGLPKSIYSGSEKLSVKDQGKGKKYDLVITSEEVKKAGAAICTKDMCLTVDETK